MTAEHQSDPNVGSGPALERLLTTVAVTPAGEDRFEGIGSTNDGAAATFGGHMVAQAVSAAYATVDEDRILHSLHGYFLRGGEPGRPFTLAVDRLRDGRSFCSRRVSVYQEVGRIQFELMASFATPSKNTGTAAAIADAGRPDPLRLDPPPPPDFHDLPSPSSLPTYRELMAGLDEPMLPEDWVNRDYGLDIRTVNAPWADAGPSDDNGIRLWIRSAAPMPNDHRVQAAVLAYQSDESLADNVAVPWGGTWGSPGVLFVSLDHAMWFHRTFDLNDWLFVEQKPITVGDGRGTATAGFYDRGGRLVATATQEALFRMTPDAIEGR